MLVFLFLLPVYHTKLRFVYDLPNAYVDTKVGIEFDQRDQNNLN